jgi:transposase
MIPRHGDSADHRRLANGSPVGDTVGMTDSPSLLPNDLDALRALLLAERAAHAAAVIARNAAVAERNTAMAQRDQLAARAAQLEHILKELRRAHFGRKSERISDDQLALALEDLETALAKAEAEDERTDESLKRERTGQRRARRNDQLDHLPHEEVVIEPEATSCPCCGGALHVIGADVSKRLDKIPATVRVIVTRRPKYACRTCTDGVVQAPAPARLIASGLPTDALVADVVVSKYADHQPLYRQAQILARHGVTIERSTLASWVGAAAAELEPLYHHLVRRLKASPKLFADETRCPVLDPGRGKTKTGYLWAMARDDRPWGGADPPAVAYAYAPGRGGEHAVALLDGYRGVLQVDGYAAYKRLTEPKRAGGPIALAYCWSHLRRRFYEIAVGGHAPIAAEALVRIGELYRVEAEIRGSPPEARRAARQARSKPIVQGLKPWLETSLAGVSKGSPIGAAIRYGLKHWDGLVLFVDDGRIEIDSNIVERAIRPIALNRKNALFAGHDQGAANWAMLASLIETCKLNGVDPLAWMTETLTKLVNLWPATRIDELMPWAYAKAASVPVNVG